MTTKKVMIKSLFHGWVKLDSRQAKKWADVTKKGMMVGDNDYKNDYINSRLKGITVEELEKL